MWRDPSDLDSTYGPGKKADGNTHGNWIRQDDITLITGLGADRPGHNVEAYYDTAGGVMRNPDTVAFANEWEAQYMWGVRSEGWYIYDGPHTYATDDTSGDWGALPVPQGPFLCIQDCQDLADYDLRAALELTTTTVGAGDIDISEADYPGVDGYSFAEGTYTYDKYGPSPFKQYSFDGACWQGCPIGAGAIVSTGDTPDAIMPGRADGGSWESGLGDYDPWDGMRRTDVDWW